MDVPIAVIGATPRDSVPFLERSCRYAMQVLRVCNAFVSFPEYGKTGILGCRRLRGVFRVRHGFFYVPTSCKRKKLR